MLNLMQVDIDVEGEQLKYANNSEKLCLGSVYKLIDQLYSLTLFQEEEENFFFCIINLSFLIPLFPSGHQAPCCDKLYTCRLCHDSNEDHQLDRFKVKEVQCINCEKIQHVRFYHISVFFLKNVKIYKIESMQIRLL